MKRSMNRQNAQAQTQTQKTQTQKTQTRAEVYQARTVLLVFALAFAAFCLAAQAANFLIH